MDEDKAKDNKPEDSEEQPTSKWGRLLQDIPAEPTTPTPKKGVGKKHPLREAADQAQMMLDKVKEEVDSRVEVGRVAIRPEWIPLHDAMDEYDREIKAIKLKQQRAHRKLWATIEDELDESREMVWDEETQTVIIYAV